MSLATRCASCGTVFRVVQDQLKVSEGWVRCGRCNQVFNALEGLFDLERETPPDWEPEDRSEAPVASAMPGQTQDRPDDADTAPVDDPELVNRIDMQLLGPHRGADIAPRDAQPLPDDRDTAAVQDAQADDATDAPGFVRSAERSERWQRPRVRAGLAVASVLLAAVLGVQVLQHFRNESAAWWPELRPVLVAWCDAVGCRVGNPRHIDAVVVESTALSRAGTSDVYRLDILLRNHAGVAVATPSIDLALTDPAGQLIVRRSISPLEFAQAPAALAPGAEATLATALTVGPTRVSGYTVALFYP